MDHRAARTQRDRQPYGQGSPGRRCPLAAGNLRAGVEARAVPLLEAPPPSFAQTRGPALPEGPPQSRSARAAAQSATSRQVHRADIGLGDAMTARVHNAQVLLKPLRHVDGAEIRMHRTVLYNSIYRADDQLLVNTHVYGEPAHNAPVLHLRRVAGGDMVTTYLTSFDKVWAAATPLA